MTKHFLILLCIIIPAILTAQSEKWDLQRAVEYAMQNNISVKQSDVQARIVALQTKLAKAATIPNLNFNTQAGEQFGRSIDPTTNLYINRNVFFQSYTLQTNVTLFNFFNIQNQKKAAKANEEASRMDVDRARSDIGLNVVAAYLQLLLSIEQINIASTQIHLTDSQRIITQKQVNAGAMPPLNVAQLESQLALDSSNYITAVSTMESNRLQMIALLNLDASQPFEVSLPDVNKIPLPPLSELEPAELFEIAKGMQPLQRVDTLRIIAGNYDVKAARGAMYPTITAFGSIGTNYGSNFQQVGGTYPVTAYIGDVNVDGTSYKVVRSDTISYLEKTPYGRQVGNINLNQSIGLQLNVPLFNGRQARTNYERAKLNLEGYKLQLALDNQTLQQNIYTARANAEAAIQKYSANRKAAAYAQYAYDLSKKRYEIGMLSTSEYLIVQNNLETAKINEASSFYDYIFRIKLLEYYKFGKVQL
jgi:outer membrane protein